MLEIACSIQIHDFKAPVKIANYSVPTKSIVTDQAWWQIFSDPLLDSLINQALSHNFNLLTVYDRLTQAQAIAKKAGAEMIPQLNLSLNGSRRIIENSHGSNTINDFSAGFLSRYELDLWGRIRSSLYAAKLDQAVAYQAVQIAKISLTAEVANSWYQLIEKRKQFQRINRQIRINQDNTSLVMTRFKRGQARAADVFQQQQLLQATKSEKITLIAKIKQYEYQISILLGAPIGTIKLPQCTQFPIFTPSRFSTALIKQRPDVQSAYLKVQAADQRIAAAIADRFPKLSLSVEINSHSPDLQSLFNNWLATLAGNLLLPVIDGQRRVAEVARSKAVFSETVNQYAQVLLNAVKEVETTVIQLHQQTLLLESLNQQVQLSRQANQQILLRYLYGGMDYLRVLSARLNLQALERQQISAERLLLQYQINLSKALAAGWDNPSPQPQTPEQWIKELE